MGKHTLQANTTARNIALAAAVGASAALLNPAPAQALPVNLGHGISFNVPNINVSNIDVPKIDVSKIQIPEINLGAGAQNGRAAAAPVQAPNLGGILQNVPGGDASIGQQIANIAMSKIGSPYVWGATGPHAFDCSGLTSWAYKQAGKTIPRTSQAQAAAGTRVSLDALRPGDIVSFYNAASHVGIYIGNGKIVHALNSGIPVRIDDLHMMPIHNAIRF